MGDDVPMADYWEPDPAEIDHRPSPDIVAAVKWWLSRHQELLGALGFNDFPRIEFVNVPGILGAYVRGSARNFNRPIIVVNASSNFQESVYRPITHRKSTWQMVEETLVHEYGHAYYAARFNTHKNFIEGAQSVLDYIMGDHLNSLEESRVENFGVHYAEHHDAQAAMQFLKPLWDF